MKQRTNGDCGIAALGLLAELDYSVVERAVLKVIEPQRVIAKDGLLNRHIVAAAALLGLVLRPTRRGELDVDDGVARVYFRNGTSPRSGHFVAVKHGLILCPTDGLGVPWDDYLERHTGRLGVLMREER